MEARASSAANCPVPEPMVPKVNTDMYQDVNGLQKAYFQCQHFKKPQNNTALRTNLNFKKNLNSAAAPKSEP